MDNPQTLNRYAYAINCPLTLSDPTGHFPSSPLALRGDTGNLDEEWNLRPESADTEEYPTVKFEVLGQIDLLGNCVTIYIQTGQTDEYKTTALSTFQAATYAVNSRADKTSARDADVFGNLKAIAITGPGTSAHSKFRTEGIAEMKGSRAIMSPGSMNDIQGIYFPVLEDV
jgi:hypothetical protein